MPLNSKLKTGARKSVALSPPDSINLQRPKADGQIQVLILAARCSRFAEILLLI
jgi:hypothetical protein